MPDQTSQWGHGAKKCENLIRFFAFCALHLTNFITNASLWLYIASNISWNSIDIFELWNSDVPYVFLLGGCQLVVGVYCCILSWNDSDLRRHQYALGGLCGRVLVSLFLGLTQLIQIKSAWGKFSRRLAVDEEDHGSDDEEPKNEDGSNAPTEPSASPFGSPVPAVGNVGGRSTATDKQRLAHLAHLENALPWTFPSKCFEGIFEGTVFAIVSLYIVYKQLFQSKDGKIQIEMLWDSHSWYAVLVCSGLLSFATIGVSMLNFDYHLCPSVQKTVDHSIRYTFFHVVYRGCETLSRIYQIVVWSLIFRGCALTGIDGWKRFIPVGLLCCDYIICVSLLLAVPAGEERRYPFSILSHRNLQSCRAMKRLGASCLISLGLFVVNLTEFVDEGERRPLKTAASRFSLIVRSGRFIELVILILLIGDPFSVACTIPTKEDRHGLTPGDFFWDRHKTTTLPAIIASGVYYLLLLLGFHRQAVNATAQTTWRTVIPALSLIAPVPGENEEALSGTAASSAGDDRATPLVAAEDGLADFMRPVPHAAAAVPPRPRPVPVSMARDSDLPAALRPRPGEAGPAGTNTWYANTDSSSPGVKRAPGLSFLLLSRGLPGTVGEMAMTTIYEDQVDDGHETDRTVEVTDERVQMSDFEVLNVLGEGSYAPVVRCRKKQDGNIFAMKRLVKQNYVKRGLAVERALPKRERDTLFLSGRHPNVAFLECAFETDTFWVLVTEICEMGSLDKYIKNKGDPGLSPEISALLTGQTLMGLDHIHGSDIMHRDIKPGNIGLGGTMDAPIAKLIDFGFAKRASAKQSRTIVGSYGYCAPEIDHARALFGALRQASEFYDERVDLYSFGICVFVMFVGREADQSGTLWNHNQFRQMLTDPECSLWHCSGYRRRQIFGDVCLQEMRDCGALDTISKLTETDPANRPRSAREAGRTGLFSVFPDTIPEEWRSSVPIVSFPRKASPSSKPGSIKSDKSDVQLV